MVWRKRRSGPWGTCLALFQVGEGLGAIACFLGYCAPWLLARIPDAAVRDALAANAWTQAYLFFPLAIAPVALTGHSIYVDVAWPAGVVALGLRALRSGGWAPRRILAGGAVAAQGGRLFFGAVYALGESSRWTFLFGEDLERYRYARERFEARHVAAAWPAKQLAAAAAPGLATAAFFAPPILLAAADAVPGFSAVEIAAYALWALSFYAENVADLQKRAFRRRRPPDGAVLGAGDFAGEAFWLWARCRHPNYFGEWAAWASLALAGVPPLARADWPPAVALGVLATYGLLVRFLYDRLVEWTGAAPAEALSLRARPAYRGYQERTRCFFPFEVPFFDHRRRPGWPDDAAFVKRRA